VALLLALMIPLTRQHGVGGAGIAYVVSLGVVMPVSFAVILRITGLRLGELVGNLWRPVTAAVGMYFVVDAACGAMGTHGGTLVLAVRLAAAVLAGAIAYATLVWIFWWLSRRPEGAESILLRRFAPRLARALGVAGAAH
jgi:O-antigen/teichoic acid export membrane protein